MPYVSRASFESDSIALVLAFGKLSVLELCAAVPGIERLEQPSERICTVKLTQSNRPLAKLAGIHKFAPVLTEFSGDGRKISDLVKSITAEADVSRFALSGYDVADEDYEDLVRMLLDAFREQGLKKVRLLRPRGNELLAEDVLSRDALDVIVFPHRGWYALGPTVWVSDTAAIRARTTARPAPSPEISMSPRLAQTLINISGLSQGQTLLDPFCGSGTILAEGLSRSLHCVGVDSNRNRIRDAKKNLDWADRSRRGRYSLRVGDAKNLSVLIGRSSVDGVVTEPFLLPRLNSRLSASMAGELMAAAGDTYARALSSIAEVLRPGGRAVIVIPVLQTVDGGEVSIELDARELGLLQYQPGKLGFRYPVRLSFESTRWIRRAVYVFESRA